MEQYGANFQATRALDGDEGSYFWALAPMQGASYMMSWAASEDPAFRLGKWFKRLWVKTGSKDRPSDQLEHGDLSVAQWLPNNRVGLLSSTSYVLRWTRGGTFNAGSAEVDPTILDRGPVVGVRISCTKQQVKWVALVEVGAEEGPARGQPTLSDIQSLSITV